MNDSIPVPTMPVATQAISEDTIFEMLAEPGRRRMFLAMGDGQFHDGKSLAAAASKNYDLARKHLQALAKAGLAIAEPAPNDRRGQRFKLAPWIRAETTPQGRRLDLGCCILRI